MLIHDHHPAYISWEQFLANEQRLARNYTQGGHRPPRKGPALCQGIVRCGVCGRPMSTQYLQWGASYGCHSRSEHAPTPSCRVVKAAPVDELVARRLLEALAPQEIALALKAADELQDRRARSNRAFELRVERARYEAVRAERAFHACEPDNRLVARSLEDRWEQKLRELKDAEAELAERSAEAPQPSREQLEALARDLPALWAAKTTSDRDRKRLLRALIADVTLKSDPHGPEVLVGIRWQSGATEQHSVTRPPRIMKPTPPEALELLKRLAPHYGNADIAAELNAAGLRTGTGRPFDELTINRLRTDHQLPRQPLLRDHELTAKQVAERLGISPGAVYYWIAHGQLEARRSHSNRLCIPFPPEIEQHCRRRVANSTQLPAQAKITTIRGAV